MLVPRQTAKRTRRALLLVIAALTLITAATTVATAKSKTKSRSKIIVVQPKKYLLTIDGRFSLTSGDIVDDGTLSVPVIPIQTIKVPGQPVIQMGTGNGRVVEHLLVKGKDCDMRGTVSFAIQVGPGIAAVPVDAAAGTAATPAAIPAGSVGFTVTGVAVGLAAAATPNPSTFDLGGIQKRKCTLSTDPFVEIPLALAGVPATDALAAANLPPLIFPSAGGTVTREKSDGELTYFFTYRLKFA